MNRRTPDLVLIVFLILLVGFGLTMVYSASSYTDGIAGFAYKTLLKQAAAVAFGAVLAAGLVVADLQTLKKYHLLPLAASILLLMAVFFFGGDGAKGAHRWINLGAVKFQPAEVVKITVILSLATWFEQRRDSINDFKHTLAPACAVLALISGLLMAQPDFGSTVVLCGTAIVMAMFAGLDNRKVGVVVGAAFHLHQVGLAGLVVGVGDGVLQLAVVGQQHQAFAVIVEAAGRVDLGNGQMVGQRGLAILRGELAQHLERLIEED